VALVAIAAAIAVLYWWLAGAPGWPPGAGPQQETRPAAERFARTTEPAPPAVEQPAAEETIPLPPLGESDTFLREEASALSSQPDWAHWLAQSELASRFAAAVDNVAEGKSPRAHLEFLRPGEPFRVLGSDPDLRVDPASSARYDAVADVVASLDADACVAVYRRIAPLLQQAYVALGYPGRSFESRLRAAIDELLAAPVLGESPALVAKTLRYQWADPAIEGLSGARRQLLRMGPRNVEKVQSKLREIRNALGQPDLER
jgi:hypothetical protein